MQLRLVQGSKASRQPRMQCPPALLDWKAMPSAPEGAHPLAGLPLSTFAGQRRFQLAVLARSAVTAGLRGAVARETWLASVRRRTYPRLVTEPTLGHVPDRVVDEGGIYSW